MNGSQGFYGQPYPALDPRHSIDAGGYTQDAGMDTIVPGTMDPTGLGQPQTLHQIVSQNAEELMRRRHTFQAQYPQISQDRTRRTSMLEFGAPVDGDFANFQFDPIPGDPALAMPDATSNIMPMQKSLDPRRVRSREDISLSARFSQMQSDFDALSTFPPGIMSSTSAGIESAAAYMPSGIDIHMGFDTLGAPVNNVNMHSGPMQDPIYTASPMDQNFSMSYPPPGHDPGGGTLSPHMHGHMATMAQGMSSLPPSFHNPAQSLPGRQSGPGPTTIPTAAGPAQTIPSPGSVHHASSRSLSVEAPSPFTNNGTVAQSSRSRQN